MKEISCQFQCNLLFFVSDGEEEQSSMEMARAREWVQSQMKGSQESNQATQGSGAVGADTPRTIIKKMHQNVGVKKLDR